ncbi:hypothetical protein CGLAMM_07365 [Acetobacteraceae bacterium EV16G]|uniref:Uncharacterized protein n=1 Tax=Sorlinia euscelidii TaxID=3081148 RepID=A0ABU7U5H8_9PROT
MIERFACPSSQPLAPKIITPALRTAGSATRTPSAKGSEPLTACQKPDASIIIFFIVKQPHPRPVRRGQLFAINDTYDGSEEIDDVGSFRIFRPVQADRLALHDGNCFCNFPYKTLAGHVPRHSNLPFTVYNTQKIAHIASPALNYSLYHFINRQNAEFIHGSFHKSCRLSHNLT